MFNETVSEIDRPSGAGNGKSVLPAATTAAGEGVNRHIFEGDFVYVGLFHCRPWQPLFQNDNFSTGDIIVFPRSSVYITHEGQETLVADPNVVVFYNQGQSYQRDRLSDAGDISQYFGFQPQILLEVLQEHDPALLEQRETPFRFTHAPSDARSYLLQRLVVQHLLSVARADVDAVFIEEVSLYLLERVLANALPRGRSPAQTAATRRAHRDLAHDTRSLLANCFQESLTLTEIAETLYTSPYHLSRVFRQQTGQTIHQYRNQLRLRAGLSSVLDSDLDLSTLALQLGYASHSHFTQAFHRAFQFTPSALRERPSLSKLSKNLTA